MWKRICVALTAVVVLAATLVSVAGADQFATEKTPATLTARQGLPNLITGAFGTTECATVTYVGSIFSSPATTATLTPTYSGCKTAGFSSTIDLNGCDYLFHIGAATTGTVDVVCPSGNEITITVNPLAPKCTIHIPSQTGLGVITYSQIESGTTRELVFAMNVSGLTTNATAGSGVGACPTFHVVTSKFDGSISVTAETAPGSTHLGIFLQ